MKTSLTPSSNQQKAQGYLSAVARMLCWVALLGLTASSCSKKEEDPEVGRLKAQLDGSVKRMEELDMEIKTSRDDAATSAVLTEEKELLKSRMERLKEKLIGAGAMERGAPAASGGGGGGGGHH